MKLTIGAGELSLPEDFTFDIESNHPFFSDEGTASIPVTIPASPENLEILEGPENFRKTKKHIRQQTAYIHAGTFRKQCRLLTESAGRSSGVSASLALLESEMYADLQERKLTDIFAGENFVSAVGEYLTPSIVYKGTEDLFFLPEPVAIFPVATDLDSNGNVFVLNQPKSDGNLMEEARTVSVDGQNVSVPAGYGIVPFFYLHTLIKLMFQYAGYEVRSNPFQTDEVLKKIVVVNNCADSNCAYDYRNPEWRINYADMVPDITAGEFISFLHDVFGAYVTYESGMIDIRLIKDDLAADPDADLSGYAVDDETVYYPDPFCLKRSYDTSLDLAEPAAETMQDLRNSYASLSNASSESGMTGKGLFLVQPLGRYFYKKTASSTAEALGSNCFSYYRELGVDAEEISSDNRFLPMIKVGDRYMPYIGKRIHRYIDVSKTEDEEKQHLQLCYAHYFSKEATETSPAESWHCGSSYSYLEDGNLAISGGMYSKTYPALTPEGLSSYWREYETLMVNGAPEITVTLYIPIEVLSKMNRYTPKIFKGSKVMIKGMSYSVNDSGMSKVDATLLVMPEYDDAIYIPPTVSFGTAYEWRLVSTRSIYSGQDGYTVLESDGLSDYTAADAPDSKPTKVGTVAKRRSRWLRYERTVIRKGFLRRVEQTYTGTHEWVEYFIAEGQGE